MPSRDELKCSPASTTPSYLQKPAILDITKDLAALFRKQVHISPDRIAVEDGDTKYTYQQLDAAVESLSNQLRQHGVHRDSLVGVLLPRGAHYVIACLAALRAGGAFLVLELAYPTDLLTDVIEEARPAAVVTHRSESGKFKDPTSLVILDEASKAEKHDLSNLSLLPPDDDLDRLSFCAVSSGTTGKPKIIANPHRAPVLSYDLRFKLSDLSPGDRVACNVFFVWEILRPLLRGATVITVPDETSYDPVALVKLLAITNATETLMTPTLLAAVLARHASLDDRLPNLRTLWLNGEVVTGDLARRAVKALPRVRLLNCYSACETHEIACGDIGQMLTDEMMYCPVGPPMDRKHIYILNESGQPVEPGTSGELFVGGDLLARGYTGRPETTARAFTPDPFDAKPGARMYRTGDLARLLPGGELEITGRVGAMIKLRGYSVVPGKVQNAITTHLAVRQCAVVAHGTDLDRQLVAYVVRDRQNTDNLPLVEIDEAGYSPAARKVLSPFLAQYMIPALWVELESLPTHDVSGKIDLQSLPEPKGNKTLVNGTRKHEDNISIDDIAQVWSDTLKVSRDSITPEHNFFDLGGHSLSLAALAAQMSRAFGIRVPVGRLADPSTLNGHLQTVREVRDGQIAAVQADLPAVLRSDSILDADIKPGPNVKLCPIKEAKTILLTGATGFLGAFLLNDLLESTSANIICLIRFKNPDDEDIPAAVGRLRRNLVDFGLWHDSIMGRVKVLPGDLSRKRFGLTVEAFADLTAQVDVIVHAAATVNLVYPYASLRAPNIWGTREVLRLACQGNATLQYISTNGVLPPSQGGWPEEAMLGIEHVPAKLADGYGQTKWVAEQLVLEAGRRGLPVRIHRAGTISGHSTTGAANAWDLLNALIVESVILGKHPAVKGWRAEMTPVDFVSKAICHLSNETEAEQTIFHLGDPNPVDMKDVFDNLKSLGYSTEPLPFDEWVTLWQQKRSSAKGGDGAFTVDILRSGMPSIEFLRGIIVLNNASTRPFRADVRRPKVDAVLLETYTRHWYARGWLPTPPKSFSSLGGSARLPTFGPLAGKVAVITGASSGIGAAVATALAHEGCHIAMGARRLNELESLKQKLVTRDGKVIIRQTDVTSREQVAGLFHAAETELGPVDILISCAGVMYFTMMANNHVDDWDRTVDVNCKGLLHCLASVVPSMLARSTGHIVAISSDAGRKVFPGLGVYSASKFFVEATLQSLRLETAGKGLRVTSVQPGNVATDLLGLSRDEEAIDKYGQPSGAKILSAEDIANSIVYALKQPAHVAVNEILIEPRDEPI